MTRRFEPIPTAIDGLVALKRTRLADERGFLTRLFCAEELAALGWAGGVAQVNETGTRAAGTVRGLHFQLPPFAEWKLVTCVAGAVFDVAVDLRAGSPSFLRHVAIELSADNALSLMIPPGFAHGFQALTDDVRLVYAHSAPYRAEAEAGLPAEDPALAIAWPLPVQHLSPRDRSHPPIDAGYRGVAA